MPMMIVFVQRFIAVFFSVLTLTLTAPAAAHDKVTKSIPIPIPIPQIGALFGGAFSLVDHDGRVRTDRDFHGRFILINFGYTNCPDICPTDLTTMASAIDTLGDHGDEVQPVFVTIDPARDTPQKLKEYLPNFHPRLIGLSGTEKQIRNVAKVYRIHRSKVIVEGALPEDYLATHSSMTFLMAPDGKFVTLFAYGTDPKFMANAIRKYLAVQPKS